MRSDARQAVLQRFEGMYLRLNDGGPFSDGPPPQAAELTLAGIVAAPPGELYALVGILRDPNVSDHDQWGRSEWDRLDEPVAQCLIGHLVVFPEVFAPIAEEIIDHPVTGKAFLSAIGMHSDFLGVLADPYLPALRRAAQAPWDEDRGLSLICALEETSSTETLEILESMRESFSPEQSEWHRWVAQAIEKVERRLAGEESMMHRTEWPEAVRKVREELALRGDPPFVNEPSSHSVKVSAHRPTPKDGIGCRRFFAGFAARRRRMKG